MNRDNEVICVCTCSALDHCVRFYTYDNELNVEVIISPYISFMDRVKAIIKYIFNRTCRYGIVCDVILDPKDFGKIRALLDKCEKEVVTDE